ncbi:MAG: hypothetical protein ABS35_22745 [Kaistia sp. SCN 65-12]|nr:MAG: hypothetical protein ABS35_22745 [Kaistia sp. SCN 65-12]
MADPAPRERFGPAPEIVDYFAEKKLAPNFSWLDVWGEEHASAFTVAKATELELLTAFRDSIRRAIDAGQGLETWKAAIEPELRRLGWWGKRLVADPGGRDPDRVVDFSNPRRLKTIFWSNMNAARAAGQWDRIQRTKEALPYLLYVHTTAADPREEHLEWVGVILPVDDPFWETHFPPNGWGCKCSIRQITRRERDRLLATKSDFIVYTSERPKIVTRPFVNRRTGEVTEVPVGIDPGWHRNPGVGRQKAIVDNLRQQVERLGEAASSSAPVVERTISDIWASTAPRDLALKRVKAPLPAAVSPELGQALDARSPVIAISPATMAQKMEKHGGVDLQDFVRLRDIIVSGTAIDRRSEGKGVTFWKQAEDEGSWWVAAVKISRDGYPYVSTLYRSSGNRLRALIERLGVWNWRGD